MGRPKKISDIPRSFGAEKDVDISFLHYPYLPLGCFSYLYGNPSAGKTTYATALCAAITAGRALPMPPQETPAVSGNILYQSTENVVGRDLKPRFIANGGDVNKAFFLKDGELDLAENCRRLENAIKAVNAVLVILDPLVSFVGKDGSDVNGAQMRRLLTSATKIAEKYNCCICGIGHMTKSPNFNNLFRGTGSISITAAARSVLMIGLDEEDPDTRVVSHIKSNFAREGVPFGFNIGDGSKVEFLGEFEGNVSGVVNAGRKMAQAKKLIVSMIAEEPRPAKEIFQAAKDAGLSPTTMNRAKKELGVKSEEMNDGSWRWLL